MTLPSTAGTDLGELTVTRVFNAPREQVFKAFIEPEQLSRFWSPIGTSLPVDRITIDARPGGAFETVMVADADGTEYPMSATYLDVVEPEKIAFTVNATGLVSTMTFSDIEGGTELVVHQTNVSAQFRTPEAVAGLNSSFDRLTEFLAQSA
ncbi:SRPBCC domain-containing protein [Streptomyces sp. NBC_01433]|uniref:SRPBCC family protein n=1 Tax=Streptomyces sp. NBC_01433 TaxID=2903864 RepID=UPI00225B6B5E|nr:SRPBCC domain-containing protein [Streptomyces sp. NBC_01433]MCX4681836.1 SRPBCC domain-containing protein [Streptomyces sp. NBC_01433]